ncbi:MAG: hypothetical protein ACLPKB_35450 [Xanthobacteraceae bacterium]
MTKEDLAAALLDRIPVLLMILGVIVFLFGAAAGGFTYGTLTVKLPLLQQITVWLAGVALFVCGIVFQSKTFALTKASARSLGITITHPVASDNKVPESVNVRGEIKKAIPDGYKLYAVRIYPEHGYFIPIKPATIDLEAKKWEAPKCTMGGKTGDHRIIGAWLVGASGKVLFDYYDRAAGLHGETVKELRTLSPTKEVKYLPLMQEKTADMFECARVEVERNDNS